MPAAELAALPIVRPAPETLHRIRTDGPFLEASTLTMDKQASIAMGW
jgi:hypothetical protein